MKGADISILVTSDAVVKGQRKDISGKLAEAIFTEAGHRIKRLDYLPNDPKKIAEWVRVACSDSNLVLVTGGTGVGRRDVSIEAVSPLFEKILPGFGELFRYETYKERGTRAWLSRAQAGVIGKCVGFIVPGAPDAVETALKLILPEIRHLGEILEWK